MIVQKITVREAQASDSSDIWAWRNDAQTRAMSRNPGYVSRESHDAWYSDALLDRRRVLLIGETSLLGNIGMVRFDLAEDGETAEISINLNPETRGMGHSRPLLEGAIEYFRARYPLPLTAMIKPGNTASIRAFGNLGFTLAHEEEGMGTYHLPLPLPKPIRRPRSRARAGL